MKKLFFILFGCLTLALTTSAQPTRLLSWKAPAPIDYASIYWSTNLTSWFLEANYTNQTFVLLSPTPRYLFFKGIGVVNGKTTFTAQFAWDSPGDPTITGYYVWWGTASGVYSSVLNVGMNLTATVTGLMPNTHYYFVATSYNASNDQSPPSNEADYQTGSSVTATNYPLVLSIR